MSQASSSHTPLRRRQRHGISALVTGTGDSCAALAADLCDAIYAENKQARTISGMVEGAHDPRYQSACAEVDELLNMLAQTPARTPQARAKKALALLLYCGPTPEGGLSHDAPEELLASLLHDVVEAAAH